MSSTYGTKIVTDGLLFGFDSSNNKFNYDSSNVLSVWPWRIGSGGETGFSQNGGSNQRIVDTNPFGNQDIIWDITDPDVTSDADGGWNGSQFAIDRNYMYRFSTWVRRKVVTGTGTFYFGCQGNNVYNRSDGALNNNPYFAGFGWSLPANEWYLVVGHIWPSGSGTGSHHTESKVYDVNGNIIYNCSDFVWTESAVNGSQRSYLYYSTSTSTNQQWWQPRVDKMDGTQPTVKDLLNGCGNNVDTLGKTQASLNEVYWTEEGYEFTPNRVNSSIELPLSTTFNKTSGTLEFWVKPDAFGGSNGLFVNRDSHTQNALDWLWVGVWSSGAWFYLRIGDGVECCAQELTIPTFSSSYPVGSWYHIVCTWESNGTSKIYINNVLAASRTIGPIPNTNPTSTGRIGLGHESVGSGSFDGKMSIFRSYNRALTLNEVKHNFNAIRGRYGL